jgi:hypothetical protein
VLSVLSFPSAGNLIYAGSAATASDLTVSTDGTKYSFHDADQTITLDPTAAGWTQVDANTVTGPDSSVSSISITTNTGDDTISIQSVDASTTINSGSGNDTFNLTANGIPAADTLTIDNTSMSGSDSMNIDTGGTPGILDTGQFGRETYQAAGQGLIDITSDKPGFSDSFTGLAAGSLTLNLNSRYTTPALLSTMISVSGGVFEADVSGVFSRCFTIADRARVSVAGTSAGESLTLDYSDCDPLPASGLTYDPAQTGGHAANSLTLQGGSFTGEAYSATGPGAGSILYDGTKTIAFMNLSPINDSVPSPTFIFTAPDVATTVNVNTDGVLAGDQEDQINDGGSGTFELINCTNKTAVTANVPAAAATTTLNTPLLPPACRP